MSQAPDRIYGPQIAELLSKLCQAVTKESNATALRVECSYMYYNGKGDFKMKTYTSADALTERTLDPNVPMRRGSKLQHEAVSQLRKVFNYLTKHGGK